MGKSALLAKWAAEHQAIRHFIREGDAATYDTVRIFENLARQLSERFQVEWKPPASSEPAAYRQAFEEVLKAAAGTGQVVVVVDGLDEAVRELTRGKGMEAVPTMVGWLPDPALLPDGVRFILSIRPELLEHAAFAAKFGKDKAEHLELDRMTDADVRAILYQVRSKYEVLAAQEYVDAIVQRSEGSPLYLRMLLEDLSEERLTFGQIADLPQGVVPYFERILEFMEGEGRTRETPDVEPLLRAKRETYAVVVARGRMTPEEVEAELERERAALEARAGVKSIALLALYCLTREPLALPAAAAILDAAPAEVQRAFEVIRTVLVDDDQGRFAVFHTGFRAYFLNLGDYTATKLHRHATTIARIQTHLLAWCSRWPEHSSPSALRHYAEHLATAERYDALYALARHEAFLHAQADTLTDEPDVPLRTLQTTLAGAMTQDDAAKMAEFCLTHAHRLMALQQESPLDALRAGAVERAWKLADLYDMARCALWYLLLTWELKDTGMVDEAQAILERLVSRELPHLWGWQAGYAGYLLLRAFDIHDAALTAMGERLLDKNAHIDLCRHLTAYGSFAAALAATQGIKVADDRVKALGALAEAQAQAGEFVAARATAQEIKSTAWRAIVEARVGFGEQSVGTAEAILTNRNQHLPQIADTLARMGDKENFKRLLCPCAYYL